MLNDIQITTLGSKPTCIYKYIRALYIQHIKKTLRISVASLHIGYESVMT